MLVSRPLYNNGTIIMPLIAGIGMLIHTKSRRTNKINPINN